MSKEPDSIELRLLFSQIFTEIGFSFKLQKINLSEKQTKTILSAEKYIQNPTEENWDLFLLDSTKSYPFGPGDGCFSVSKIGIADCQSGSGCKSGIGTLAFIALPEDHIWSIVKEIIQIGKLEIVFNGNTLEIRQIESNNFMDWNQAKKKCADFGKSWRLPTISELKVIYKEMHKKAIFHPNIYWTGTETSSLRVWVMNFENGTEDYGFHKNQLAKLIIVRTKPEL